MNDYEAKLEARRQRFAARAEKARAESARFHKASHALVEHIPMGQPILVGHHSEKRHRRALDRSWNYLGKAVEADKKAGYYEGRADSVGTAGISSDDPDGLDKLKEKVAKLEANQARMAAANKLVRKHKKDIEAGVVALGVLDPVHFPPIIARKLFEPDFMGRYGFAGYELSNNNANIRRIKQRIAQLEAKKSKAAEIEAATGQPIKEHMVGNSTRIVENYEANRLQIFFPGKPEAEMRQNLKRAGFRWSPTEGAWQRHLSNSALWQAQRLLGLTTQ